MKPINYDNILAECEKNARSFDHLKNKLKMANKQIVQQVTTQKIEDYFSRKFSSKQKQIVNHVAGQMREKLESIFERETVKLLDQLKINQNLKVFDYVYERNHTLSQIEENAFDWHDEEEQYLDSLRKHLSDYYKNM